jgi:3-phosphoshikimate 1-carboxyvinyltransferase
MKSLPDPYEIKPLTKPPNCTITVPGSKSITNRALILAALAKGKCTLRGALWADDTQVMVDSLQKLGFEVTVEPDPAEECNRTITVVGRGGEIPAKKADLYVGNAGTAARFLTALVCLGHGEYTIRGDPRMHERPMKELFDALRKLGAKIEAEKDFLPARIQANGLNSKSVVIDLSRSSQFASALILVSKHTKDGDLDVITEAQERAGGDELNYFVMTQKMLKMWPASEHYDYDIEADASSASYFLAVAHILHGHVKVEKYLSIYQMDFNFSRLLQSPPQEVSRAFNLGDSIMTLAICAVFGNQSLKIIDAAKMRLQETDRIKAMVTELRRVGAKAEEQEDGFTVWPAKPGQLHGADIETYNDHRMAMCFSVLGLKVPGIRIKNPQCVSKTFPNFFEKLEQLRQ